jgi:hypothetical protein
MEAIYMSQISTTSIGKDLQRIFEKQSHLDLISHLRTAYEDQMTSYIKKYISRSEKFVDECVVAQQEIACTAVPDRSRVYLEVLQEIVKYEEFYANKESVKQCFDWIVDHGLVTEAYQNDEVTVEEVSL